MPGVLLSTSDSSSVSLCVSTLNQVLKLLCFFAKGAFFNRLFFAISIVGLDIVSISFAFPQTALTVDCRQFQLSASSPNICLWFAKRRLDFNTLSLIHQNILNNLTSALHVFLFYIQMYTVQCFFKDLPSMLKEIFASVKYLCCQNLQICPRMIVISTSSMLNQMMLQC